MEVTNNEEITPNVCCCDSYCGPGCLCVCRSDRLAGSCGAATTWNNRFAGHCGDNRLAGRTSTERNNLNQHYDDDNPYDSQFDSLRALSGFCIEDRIPAFRGTVFVCLLST